MKITRNIIIRATKLILVIFLISGIILFNKIFNLERVIKIHIEMEKELGEKEVNQQLYLYNAQNAINKLIVTDYVYLYVLPELNKYNYYEKVQNLDSSNTILNDDSIGYLLSTPSDDSTRDVPDFIEIRIKSGQYKEIFNCKGYRFIEIH